MSGSRDETSASDGRAAGAGRADAGDALWSELTAAESASAFCHAWLGIQLAQIRDARAGVLILLDEDTGRFAPAAVWPERTIDVTGLAATAEQALVQRRGIVVDPSAGGTGDRQVAYPVVIRERLYGAIVVELGDRPPEDLQAVLRQLLWGAAWLETLFRRRAGQQDEALLERRGAALAVLARASECSHPRETALALATDLATRLGAETVAVGLLQGGGRISLAALSHNAWFDERTRIVAAIENAMEESLDQAATVSLPPLPGSPTRVALAHQDLIRCTAMGTAASVALTNAGRPVGAITLLWAQGGATAPLARLRIAETVGLLVGPLLAAQQDSDRWVGGRIVRGGKALLARLFGPREPGLKLAAVLLLAAVAGLATATGTFHVTAKAQVEGAVQRAAVVPFDGFLVSAPKTAGDAVAQGEVLATLDDTDLALEAVRWKSEREQQLIRYNEALGKHDRAQARISGALAAQAQAQLQLVEDKLARSRIVAPFDGILVSGDLSQMLGSPVERGKVLFEVAPRDAYRLILQVDERDVAQVVAGQSGHLVLTAFAGDTRELRVTKLTPVASVQDGRNVFRVEADLVGSDESLRPGLEGVAKVDVGPRPLLWIWTRPLLDWVRMTLWSWFGMRP